MTWLDSLLGTGAARQDVRRGDTTIGRSNVRLTRLEKLERDVRRFRLAASQATDPDKRARHEANLARASALLAALEMEAR